MIKPSFELARLFYNAGFGQPCNQFSQISLDAKSDLTVSFDAQRLIV
jgi:hypothetical protein